MEFIFRRGFLVYKDSNKNLAIACPHSGPALENATSRDDNSETVASICWKLMGGNLIIGNMPRKRLYGVDFNRDIPSFSMAKEHFNVFKSGKDYNKIYEYRKKYAFVAMDENDYESRLKIYQSFWGEIGGCKNILLVHRAFNRMKAYPSIIDFVTFKEKGIKKKVIDKIVTKVNKKYKLFFEKIEHPYKDFILFESQRFVANIIENYGSFNFNKFSEEVKGSFRKDLEKIRRYTSPYLVKRLEENFTHHNYLECVKNALSNAPHPIATVENVFDGSLALGPERKLFPVKKKTIIEAEGSYFMNFWYPQKTAEIIRDVVGKLF